MATSKSPVLPVSNASGGSGKFLRLLVALLLLLLVVVASVAGTWYFMSRYQQQQQQAAVQLGVGQAGGLVGANGGLVGTNGGLVGASGGLIGANVAPATPPAVVPPPIFIPLEPFTVTLNDADSERIMHVGITLRAGDDQTRQRIDRYMPEVRNRLLMVLSSQTPQSVQTVDGKQNMAKSLMAAINRPFSPLPDGQNVTDVLFTAFVVQ
ncbi:flagellar basal body-associated FliL family protein [Bordetella avium]|uniref:Flagellar protein FliL n=1 Tax=Bordetella avium (strain 197N) TaxID=360910 RepID=Q2L191_BORA1|nr:flagellar basal body-associated FliL family protein [Bordetella avium]AZY52446.1 flagellar basal body-associated protein FliL [Bordetella avium]RIQ19390.1 flagellar basal body-associated protein FliL [Bordetella avium]RIQ33559.1 flagellar basal body-associated protein FliL [Bordetella avium]RIQ48495.1 flagellar basal body-associated protein FliL [Bordetella avium]RIQ71252.1 flagellar basal body-associated protein FliL [Bordetella avium]